MEAKVVGFDVEDMAKAAASILVGVHVGVGDDAAVTDAVVTLDVIGADPSLLIVHHILRADSTWQGRDIYDPSFIAQSSMERAVTDRAEQGFTKIVIAGYANAACTLVNLSCSSRQWHSLCISELRQLQPRLYRARVNSLAYHLHAFTGFMLNEEFLLEVIRSMRASEKRLLQELHLQPAPLLALDSEQGRSASWLLMRLSLFRPSALDELDHEHPEPASNSERRGVLRLPLQEGADGGSSEQEAASAAGSSATPGALTDDEPIGGGSSAADSSGGRSDSGDGILPRGVTEPPEGIAAASGLLRLGDRLVAVNDEPTISGHASATKALKSAVGELRLQIVRGGDDDTGGGEMEIEVVLHKPRPTSKLGIVLSSQSEETGVITITGLGLTNEWREHIGGETSAMYSLQ